MSSGSDVSISAGTDIGVGIVYAPGDHGSGSAVLTADGGGITFDTISTLGDAALTAEKTVTGTLLSSGGNVDVQSRTGRIAIAESNAVGALALQAGQDITGDLAYTETGDITIASTSGAVNQTQVSSGGDVSISAGTDIGVGIVYAPGDHGSGSAVLTADGGGITFDTISTLGDAALTAEKTVTGTLLSSGGNVDVLSRTGGIAIAESNAVGALALQAAQNITGDLAYTETGDITIASTSGAVNQTQVSSGGDVSISAGTDIGVGIVYAPGDNGTGNATLTADTGGITFDTISTLSDTVLRAETGIAGTLLSSGGNVDVQSRTGGIAIAESNAVGILALQAAQDITGDLAYTETGDITIASTSGAVNQTQVSSGGDVSISAGTDIGVGIVYAPGDHGSGSAVLTADGGGITFDTISTLSNAALTAEKTVTGTLLSSGGNVDVLSRSGGIAIAESNAVGALALQAAQDITGDLAYTETGDITIASTSGAVDQTQVSSGSDVSISAGTDIGVGIVYAPGDHGSGSAVLTAESGGITFDTISTLSDTVLRAETGIAGTLLSSGGNVDVQSRTGGIAIAESNAVGILALQAAQDITGDLAYTETGDITIASTSGAVNQTQVSSGGDVSISAGTDIGVGIVYAPGDNGTGNATLTADTGGYHFRHHIDIE